MDIEATVRELVDAHNEVVKSREFGAFVMKWFAVPDCMISFTHDATGLDRAMIMWKHLLPAGTGERAPRMVEQSVYKIDGGRVFTLRAVKRGDESRPGDPSAGGGPRVLWGWQETEFDDQMLISELVVLSQDDDPHLDVDEGLGKTRRGRVFMEFADVFNEYFRTGNADLLAEWCSPNIRVRINDTFHGMACAAPLNRLPQTLRFELRGVEEKDGRVLVHLHLWEWGALDMDGTWDLLLNEEGKLREHLITIDV